MAINFKPYRRRYCRFCEKKIDKVDYKDVDLLKYFITDRGKIIPRRISGTCARHQRQLTTAVKRARILALLPFVGE
ncbi:MAG: 30S ribosomal protein S18 [Candidatus Coatesbacteria bacterium]|nr:MAG: 30S ribosomal protein S18 [Candidatus Coatesbacteria bacterium]HDM59816.1 30S ribosomal protein S18 [Bacillota bacterium]